MRFFAGASKILPMSRAAVVRDSMASRAATGKAQASSAATWRLSCSTGQRKRSSKLDMAFLGTSSQSSSVFSASRLCASSTGTRRKLGSLCTTLSTVGIVVLCVLVSALKLLDVAVAVSTKAPKATPQMGNAAKAAAGISAEEPGSSPAKAKATPMGGNKHAIR